MTEKFSRPCPLGSHWVSTHPRRVPTSSRHPNGITIVDGHCRRNPSRKEMILPSELKYIEEKYFKNNTALPSPHPLEFKNKALKYDALIGGWVRFWNEILDPAVPLDPDIVKALIAGESGFNEKAESPSQDGKAIGIMQVTEGTLKILKSEKSELSNFLVKITKNDLKDPSLNIAAGTRWLFRKQETAKAKLGRDPTWPEVIQDYKGILKQDNHVKERIMRRFNEHLSLLKLGRQ